MATYSKMPPKKMPKKPMMEKGERMMPGMPPKGMMEKGKAKKKK